jgi:hypothetical protein
VADVVIRPYEDADEDSVLELLAASLGKTVDDRYRQLFRWKHMENPFGRSFMWIGELDGQIAGFRSFLRWRFTDPGGDPVEAVRAVDTATHPGCQGLGIFRTLTLHGLDEMGPAGISFVFNTPNDQSRPGYLKMGWHVAGRVPMQVRPRSPRSLWHMARSRTAADPWSVSTHVGEPLDDVVDLTAVRLGGRATSELVTDRSPAFLRWRYEGCPGVASRAVRADAGAVLLRFRQRGTALECTIADVVGCADPRAVGVAVRNALREGGADYAIASTATPVAGMVSSRRVGPTQTRRDLASPSNALPLALTLGDVELF